VDSLGGRDESKKGIPLKVYSYHDKILFLTKRYSKNSCLMLTGLSMQVLGCGCLHHHSSNNFFQYMIQLSLEEKQTQMGITSGFQL